MASRFLIIGNGRTGSTWLLTSLDRLHDVNARQELKWPEEGIVEHRSAQHVLGRGRSVLRTIELVAKDASVPASVLGSKLILNPYKFYGPAVFASLAGSLEREVRLILLKRSYLEIWLSWNVRGVHHELNEAVAIAGHNPLLEAVKRLDKPQTNHLVLYHHDRPLLDYAGQSIPYPLSYAVDGLLQYYANDLQLLALCQGHGGLVIDYRNVAARLPEIVRFIGAKADTAQIDDILREPQTLKLARLEEYLHPMSPLQEIAAALDLAFTETVAGSIDLDVAFSWKSADTIEICVPGVAAAMAAAGLAAEGQRMAWTIQRPVISS